MRDYCTYFDHRYLPRGLVLANSLQRWSPGSRLWVLCLDAACEQQLRQLADPGLRIVPLAELEAADPGLAACRGDRSLVEYYFTCTPCLPRFLLRREASIDSITYLDADLCFFDDPEPLFEEIGTDSVAIVPHRYPPALAAREKPYGRYNVGWLSFRRDQAGLACLDWWRERCLAWCRDVPEEGRFADQKYLEEFESRFDGVHVIRHPGANLAPWNLGNHRLEAGPRGLLVDGRPLVFFHFHGVRQIGESLFDLRLDEYRARLDPVLRGLAYGPYLEQLQQHRRWQSRLSPHAPAAELRASRPRSGLRSRAGNLWRLGLAWWRETLMRVPPLTLPP